MHERARNADTSTPKVAVIGQCRPPLDMFLGKGEKSFASFGKLNCAWWKGLLVLHRNFITSTVGNPNAYFHLPITLNRLGRSEDGGGI